MIAFDTPLPMHNDETKTSMALTPEEEEFAQLFTEGVGIELGTSIRRGEIVQGKVVGISNDSVFIDLGGKAEGVIDVRELCRPFRCLRAQRTGQAGDRCAAHATRLASHSVHGMAIPLRGGLSGDYATLR